MENLARTPTGNRGSTTVGPLTTLWALTYGGANKDLPNGLPMDSCYKLLMDLYKVKNLADLTFFTADLS